MKASFGAAQQLEGWARRPAVAAAAGAEHSAATVLVCGAIKQVLKQVLCLCAVEAACMYQRHLPESTCGEAVCV